MMDTVFHPIFSADRLIMPRSVEGLYPRKLWISSCTSSAMLKRTRASGGSDLMTCQCIHPIVPMTDSRVFARSFITHSDIACWAALAPSM